MNDLLLALVALSGMLLVATILKRYHSSDDAKFHGDFHGLQMRVSVMASKVAILEQYVEEIWHESPTGVFEKLIRLQAIRDEVLQKVYEISSTAKSKNNHEARDLLTHTLEHNEWEKKSSRLILALCKDLTLDATLAKKADLNQEDRGYKRKPTLLSLKEIADLLREERSVRH